VAGPWCKSQAKKLTCSAAALMLAFKSRGQTIGLWALLG
jgi:hypothetical protein